MTVMYLHDPDPARIEAVTQDLLRRESLPADNIRILTREPAAFRRVPVAVVRYHRGSNQMADAILAGILLGILIASPLVLLGQTGMVPVVLFAVVGGVGGGLIHLWRGYAHGLAGRVEDVDTFMRDSETIAVVDVDDEQRASVEQRVREHYPDLRVHDTAYGGG